jgi:long-subunit fatty acid transport protein
MYDEGNLVSFGSVRKDFSVNGSAFGTTKSLIGDRSASNLSAKYQVNDKLSLGLTAYDSGAIHINYQGAGGQGPGALTNINTAGPKVNLESDSLALMARYSIGEGFSLTGGLRYDKYSVADADIFRLAATTLKPSVSSATDTVPVFAVAYSKPDIALRVELLIQGKADVEMLTSCAYAAPFSCSTDKSTGGLAQFTTLNFQSGIMEDTLLFGSVHKGKWSKSQLSVADTGADAPLNVPLGQAGPTSAFEDSTEFSLGLGRKFNDKFSASVSYNWEKAGDGTTGSLFTVNDGYKGITIGGKYTIDNIELSAGYNYTKLGKVVYNSLNTLEENSVSAVGAKVTFRF